MQWLRNRKIINTTYEFYCLNIISLLLFTLFHFPTYRVADFVICRIPKDVNCLRIVECILGANRRSKLFRSAVAYQILLSCFDYKVVKLISILLNDISQFVERYLIFGNRSNLSFNNFIKSQLLGNMACHRMSCFKKCNVLGSIYVKSI